MYLTKEDYNNIEQLCNRKKTLLSKRDKFEQQFSLDNKKEPYMIGLEKIDNEIVLIDTILEDLRGSNENRDR